MGPRLAEGAACTGCGACAAACRKGCIRLETDELGARTPSVNADECSGCGACARACHALADDLFYEKSEDVHAAWQSCADDRRTSASGGVASACYRWALSRGVRCYGVPSDDLYGFRFIELSNEEDVLRCKNSKYVESDMTGVFESAKGELKAGGEVLFIGLPCQVAALRTYVGPRWRNGLLTVDIICHGVCPSLYLREHVGGVEAAKKRTALRICFRDPMFETYKFRLTLSDTQGIFYNKGPKSSDAYQVGYHSALTYRENCFACRYAQGRRAGDLTIGDFSGYGRRGPSAAPVEKVSCAIASTPAGAHLLGELAAFGIVSERRDSDEAFLYEMQLQSPSVRSPGREAFLEAYASGVGFDAAVRFAIGGELRRNGMAEALRLRELDRLARSLVPNGLKGAIRKCLKR